MPVVTLASDPTSNQLLAALPTAEMARWRDQLEFVELPLGQVLHEIGNANSHVYFPTTAIVSLVDLTVDGDSVGIAMVGNEGMVGVCVFMGGDTTPTQAVVQSAGAGFRLNSEVIKAEFEHSTPVVHLLLRYTQALITQLGQTALCNRYHMIDQQLCRWLLMSLDRLPGRELTLTQELAAHMLGVRREGVTEAAQKLQREGLISYSRGHVTVLDRPGLERRACECYAVVQAEYVRLLPPCTAT